MARLERKTAATTKKGEAYRCQVCGYRVVVDRACGCAEEHVFVCCDKPMKKEPAKRTTGKKSAASKTAKKKK